MRALRLLLVAAISTLSGARIAAAQTYEKLGTLEKQGVDEALAARGLVLEPTPAGRTIGTVHVVTLEVFAQRDLFFDWFNIFHRTTREWMIQREALFRPGDKYDQTIVDETTRNLQSPDLTSTVAILPVKSANPEYVDVLIVTRDVWSLRFNTNFEYQQGDLIYLTTSLSENNLFGWRKSVAMVLTMDQGAIGVGPTYVDRNIAGTRLQLTSSVRALFSRETRTGEGSSSITTLKYPLFSLASKWGAAISVGHSDAIVRRFLGNQLRKVMLMNTPAGVEYPWMYRLKSFSTGGSVTRSFQRPGVIQRVTGGYGFSLTEPSFTADFPEDPQMPLDPAAPTPRQQFAASIFPRFRRLSSVSVGYSVFTPRYLTYRDLNTFDLAEYQTLGPSAGFSVGRALTALGSEVEYSSVDASAAWTLALGGGLQSISVAWGSLIQSGELTDQIYSASAYVASPVFARVLRVIGSLGAGTVVDDTQNANYSAGGDSGLRGYAVGAFIGKARFLGHLELRSMAVKVISLRLGGLLFYDVGDASTPMVTGSAVARAFKSLGGMTPHHDVGVGFRLLIPQFNAYVIRVDWAFAMNDAPNTRAGWPGRISAGFEQIF